MYLQTGSTCNAREERNPEHATMLRFSKDGKIKKFRPLSKKYIPSNNLQLPRKKQIEQPLLTKNKVHNTFILYVLLSSIISK